MFTDCHVTDCNECAMCDVCKAYQDARALYVLDLADEIADCIQACVNLAARYDIDLPCAMKRCEERNRIRGRYKG